MIDRWVLQCDCDDPSQVVAGVHYEPSDWYLCTVKNLAVARDRRGEGLGREITQDIAAKASQDPDCLVLAADVTYDNTPSIRSLQTAGFRQVGRFCWEQGEKPADIMHLVRFQPTEEMECLGPD